MTSGGGGAGAGLMSCVREGSLEPPYRPPHSDNNHGEGRTGRFLRGLRRMFKRRGSGARTDDSPDPRSSSTSELLDAERHARRKEGAYGSGLSVSHDSVFTGERSGDESSDERPTPAHGLAQIANSHRAELVAAVRRRGRGDASDDDEDLGLPRSPPASPPTDKADKRHHAGISQSSCSDGSLLSVGSSEMDEDSSSGHHYSHDHSAKSDHSDAYMSSEPPSGVAPLSHSAARHKMAVRPRRTHGAPRRKRNNPMTATALPITPELNEEMIRSTTPEVSHSSSEVVTESFSSSTITKHHVIIKEQHQLVNRELEKILETPNDTKMKSSSLPPGLALSQVMGQSPAKLSIAESNTPRSSIKRSKSSSQGQSLRDNSPKKQGAIRESRIHNYHSEERVSKYRIDSKQAEEPCLDKKSKSEKKIESDVARSTKKEESFFSRWLMRKSGKKTKKDQIDGEYQEVKKSKIDKATAQYKIVDTERSGPLSGDQGQGSKPMPAEKPHKSAGQKVFANQMHKRIDTKGAYVQEGVYKDTYDSSKVSGAGYNGTDFKISEETDKMENLETKNRFSRREEFTERTEKIRRKTCQETREEKVGSFNFHDTTKRVSSVQRTGDPFSSKSFINNEVANITKEESQTISVTSDDEATIRVQRMKKNYTDSVFHSGNITKNVPYFHPSIVVSESASPPKIHDSSEIAKQHRSSEIPEVKEKIVECKLDKNYHVTKIEESYVTSGLGSLEEDSVGTRGSIGKSHSFRFASETTSESSQDNQMPSLPAIVGISDSPMESWEINYRKNLSDRHDYSKRVSARNYMLNGTNEANYDSLPSSDSSYLDSLRTDIGEIKPFTNSINITIDTNKRDSDISQIEAKIDDIISSPKPIIAPVLLKSSSLDSVKSSPEKLTEDKRKTISVESALSQGGKLNEKDLRYDTENFVSVTHINKEQSPIIVKTIDVQKVNKTDEKLQKSGTTKSEIPEFLYLQLNKVDPKPVTNVVLTANITSKRIDSPQADKELEIASFEISETKEVHNIPVRKDAIVSKIVENFCENNLLEDKKSPLITRKSTILSALPQSPTSVKKYLKKKSSSDEVQERTEKPRANSVSTDGSIEKINDNLSLDQKSHSSFGSKSSIQSTDSSEVRTPDRHEETVILRKKPVILSKELRGDKKNDDEPELMKVFARRSLKIKDSEAESIAQEIAETNKTKEAMIDSSIIKSKILKNEFNASLKSRDSDKENEDTSKEINEEKENISTVISARVSQFGAQYQRSVSINNVTPKRESAPAFRSEVNKYKKEISDSTPEKRLRNRTFPDLSSDREDMKSMGRNEIAYRDTLKKSWLRKDDDNFRLSIDKDRLEETVIDKDGDKEKVQNGKEKTEVEVDESLQFKCIFERRKEWEKRAQQGMTK